MKYDLENRTKDYSKKILKFVKDLNITIVNENLIKQLLRSATSIGANYHEANGAISKSDFKSKIFICKKEAKETLYWLDLLFEVVDNRKIREIEILNKEAKEIMLIFSKISSTLKY